jgi:hypothetical protein
MFGFFLGKFNRHCRVCRRPVGSAGVRRGFRVFCSPAHLKQHAEEAKMRERVDRWIGNKKAGGCC